MGLLRQLGRGAAVAVMVATFASPWTYADGARASGGSRPKTTAAPARRLPERRRLAKIGVGGALFADFSPDGRLVAVARQQGSVVLWDAATRKIARTLTVTGMPQCIAFSCDGARLACASGTEGRGSLRIWRVADGKTLEEYALRSHLPGALCFTGDGRLRGAWRDNGDFEMGVWELHVTGGRRKARHLVGIGIASRAFVLSSRGRFLCGANVRVRFTGSGRDLRVWDVDRNMEVALCNGVWTARPALAASADGRLVAGGGNLRYVAFWDAGTGTCLGGVGAHKDEICAIRFSRDGRALASGDAGGQVCVYDIVAGALLVDHRLWTGPVESVCLSPRGEYLITCMGGEASVWDLTHLGQPATQSSSLDMPSLRRELEALGSSDAKRAFLAARRMAGGGRASIRFLKVALRPKGPSRKLVNSLVGRLSSDSCAVRQQADRRLRLLGREALPVLREARKAASDPEPIARLEAIIRELEQSPPSTTERRYLRAVQVLEWLSAHGESRRILKQWRDAAPGDVVRAEAGRGLRRLGEPWAAPTRRQYPKPRPTRPCR